MKIISKFNPLRLTAKSYLQSILAGDFVLGRAMEIIAEINNEEVSILLHTVWADSRSHCAGWLIYVYNLNIQMIDHIVIGEIMQLSAGATEEERFAHYIEKTFKKTASLLAHCCQAVKWLFPIIFFIDSFWLTHLLLFVKVGVLSGADSKMQEMGFKLGRQLGMAFQFIDDILDFSSTSAQLGKAAAVDLSQGLANAPVLFAAQQVRISNIYELSW